jgi:hypothetical protein
MVARQSRDPQQQTNDDDRQRLLQSALHPLTVETAKMSLSIASFEINHDLISPMS